MSSRRRARSVPLAGGRAVPSFVKWGGAALIFAGGGYAAYYRGVPEWFAGGLTGNALLLWYVLTALGFNYLSVMIGGSLTAFFVGFLLYMTAPSGINAWSVGAFVLWVLSIPAFLYFAVRAWAERSDPDDSGQGGFAAWAESSERNSSKSRS